MKNIKRISAIILAIVIAFTIIPTSMVKAATDNFPTKFRVYGWGGYETKKTITVSDPHMYIANVKSKSSNLIVGLTDYRFDADASNADTYTLALLAKKKGTFDFTYDLMKDGKKVKTIKAKAYAYDNPITITLNGKKTYEYSYGTDTHGKLSVKSDKGNSISKIEVGTYKITGNSDNYSSQFVYKEVKNNSSIELGKSANNKKYSYVNEASNVKNENFYEGVRAATEIRVAYKDKYTKQNEQVNVVFYGLAK